ncbi:MAG TPA: RNA polymerase sigma factor [Candidatus Paceibacterota bacterium]|jgi:RNA polymerase sigma-70 factor (ECF subfamily)|nr:RNA polymerase sigma factor [Candidatus Paceibacterota bacterium]
MQSDIKRKFEEIYSEESDAIFRFCLTRVSNREQALDLAQETFLRLWTSLMEKKDILNNKAFLFTVARRLIIDWYRKKKSVSLENIMYKDGEMEYEPMDEKTAKDSNFGAEGRYLVDKINELPPTARDPIYLSFVEGLSPKEIGDILGISANATSVRINRGLSELRKITGYDIKENKNETE